MIKNRSQDVLFCETEFVICLKEIDYILYENIIIMNLAIIC